MSFIKIITGALTFVFFTGCATIVNDAMVPISLSFSDGTAGDCTIRNKRGIWETEIPATPYVRRSDDDLQLSCRTDDGRTAVGTVQSRMGAEIAASIVFWDLGITDAITDKHRYYESSYVIPVVARTQ